MRKTLRRYITKPRTALLIVLVLLSLAIYQENFSRSTAFVCYGVETTDRYYSDATYSTLVGKCVENECKGTYVCTGTQTEFVQTSTRGILCNRCDPMCGGGCWPGPASTSTGK
jgi:hypothetical protein